jgi:cell division septal protein FtsQ
MSSVAAPADRRFRRAHVKPSRSRRRRAGGVKPLLQYGLAVVVVAYGVYVGSTIVAHAHVLRVDRILVRGTERLSQGEVLAVLSGLRGESLVWTNLDRWRERLLASPWVRDAALRRSLPSTVEVLVWERQPIAIGRLNDEMYLVDDGGTIIAQYGPQYEDLDLPIIDGLAASTPSPGLTIDGARAALAARVVAALKGNADIAGRLSQIDVSDLHNARVIVSGDAAVISLGEDQFLARLERYLDLARALRDHVAEIDSVDVRFENRIYVRPKKR